MDISKTFSITDFLAYLFPGILGTLGIFFLLLSTPLNTVLSKISIDFSTGVIFLTISYILGIIFSGFSGISLNFFRRVTKRKTPREKLDVLDVFPNEVISAFKDTFRIPKDKEIEWTEEHYCMCRSMIAEFMPETNQDARRQSNLRQIRKNLVIPILIWFANGMVQGVSEIANGTQEWGIITIAVSVVLAFWILRTLIHRMNENNRIEVRRVLLGFLAAYRIGLFNIDDKKTAIEKRSRIKDSL